MTQNDPETYPRLRPAGLGGLVVQFAPVLTDPANRAALAFRAAIDQAGWPDVIETATALVSVFLRFDPLVAGDLHARIARLLASRDWVAAAEAPAAALAPATAERGTHHVPVVLDGPDLAAAAALAGMDVAQARASLLAQSLRVLTLGFAPGQPYLGLLPAPWAIPRRDQVTPRVPAGALVVAVGQAIIFSAAAPTGWWWVGTTAFRTFRPDSATPFPLRPGDTVRLQAASASEIALQRQQAGLA